MTAKPTIYHHPLLELVESRLALVLNDHRVTDIMKVVEGLRSDGQICGAQDLANRLSALATTHPLWQHVIRVATIGETYFFRDRSQIDALWDSVLPDLISERIRTGRRHLSLWSAGCSTGEEPYSLAIMLRELIPDIQNWNIRILATDLNNNHLDRAEQGLYRAWSFRSETPSAIRERWFNEEVGGLRIDPAIRKMVTFAPLNLAGSVYLCQDAPIRDMDVVLCRNVLIYFDRSTVSATIKRFHDSLGDNGWLVIGHSESAHMANQPFEVRNFVGAVLFQKVPKQTPFEPQFIEQADRAPVSKPTLLAPVIAQPTATTVARREPKVAVESAKNDKPDPWKQAYDAANKEDWTGALEWLEAAEVTHKLRPEVHYLRGIVEMQQGEIEKALASLRRAIYCKHEFVLAHFTIGEIFEKVGQAKKAASHWKQAQQILAELPPDQPIESSDSLTVEMLTTVLEYRLENLTGKS
jgi:chemotaxis protein methyltransferase CheR